MRYRLKLPKLFADKRVLALAFGIACLAIVYFLASRQSLSRFGGEYAAYAELAKAQQDAAYLPAAPNNPVRQQLNLVLSEALQSQTPSSKRLADAKLGRTLLAELEGQVDAIGSTSEKADASLAGLQVRYLGSLATPSSVREIITLAKQRSALIEDIRGLSYRADFDTRKIFERIISDNGALTAAHIEELNGEVPEIETQFDRRSTLYGELGDLSARIDADAAALGPAFSRP